MWNNLKNYFSYDFQKRMRNSFFYYTLVKTNHNPETKHSFLAYYKKEFFNYMNNW
jgi:ABC-type transport system involved in multi-copper enzyme maturation permease subunit